MKLESQIASVNLNLAKTKDEAFQAELQTAAGLLKEELKLLQEVYKVVDRRLPAGVQQRELDALVAASEAAKDILDANLDQTLKEINQTREQERQARLDDIREYAVPLREEVELLQRRNRYLMEGFSPEMIERAERRLQLEKENLATKHLSLIHI